MSESEQTPPVQPLELSRAPTHVVGIGASAGGLQALESFFGAMPHDTGLAFVVVQHLSPDFKSLMEDLLSRHTRMPVRRAEDGTPVAANTIYLIPPRCQLTIAGGTLHTTAREGPGQGELPINIFLASLAADFGERSVAVVLSGTGTDGSRGVRQVDLAGGLVAVQAPESAQFDGMPRAALATGAVDLVLPPEKLPAAILEWIRKPGSRATLLEAATGDPDEFAAVFHLLKGACGVDFSRYKQGTVKRRIGRRMAMLKVGSVADYAAHLQRNPDEVESLYHDLLIGVTEFFRDPDAYAALAREVIPKLLARADPEDGVRAWVAGCATGEEAYSIAILLDEAAEASGFRGRISIFSTDIHRSSLQIASNGVYDESRIAGVSPERRSKYFVPIGAGRHKVTSRLRKLIVFAPHNLVTDPPFTRLDLVTCRNLLIYLEQPSQDRVLSLFHFSLRQGGALFLGSSEGLGRLAHEFEPVASPWKIFRKIRELPPPVEIRTAATAPIETPPPIAPPASALQPAGRSTVAIDRALLHDYDQLLRRYIPPGFLINEHNQVLHYFGEARRNAVPVEGRTTADFLELLEGELRLAVTTALQRARTSLQPVTMAGVRIGTEGDDAVVDLLAEPLPDPRAGHVHVYVGLLSRREVPAAPVTEYSPDSARDRRIRELETELAGLREHLQLTVEELQTSNEELQASNEEMLASNEELQSTNEELHSVNEELYTVNSELERKNNELKTLNEDYDNLLRCTNFGLVFLDAELRIRKFNPAIADFLDLLPQDIGRPIDHIAYRVEGQRESMMENVRSVLATGRTVEREVCLSDGRWFLKRILPFRTGEQRIEGVILTFTEITSVKSAEQAFLAYRDRFLAAAKSGFDPFFLLTARVRSDGTVVDFLIEEMNAAAERFLGRSRDQTVGSLLTECLPTWKDDARHMPEYRRVFETGLPILRELEIRTPQDRVVWARQQVIRVGGHVAMTLSDLTREHEYQLALLLRDRAIDEAPVGIVIVDALRPEMPIIYVNRTHTQMTGYSFEESVGRNCRFLQGSDRDQPALQRLRRALRRGEACTVTLRNYRRNGEPFWNQLTVGPVRNRDGVVTHYIGTQLDVTERKRDAEERERLERRMEEAQRLEGLGLLAGGIAHDFNNLLTSILCSANVLRIDQAQGRLDADAIDQIEVACRQGSALCRQLLAYAGKGKFVIDRIDLALVAEDALRIARPILREGVQARLHATPGTCVVEGDATQIGQIIINLVLNANDALRTRGSSILIQVQQLEATATFLAERDVDLPAGTYAHLKIADDGIGMTAAVRERLFEPFFTTKDSGHGLGLPAVLGIVRGHHGAIWVESEPGVGTEFNILLPLAGDRAEAPAEPLPSASTATRGGVARPTERRPGALVVDDEPLVLKGASILLERLGFEVFAADNGESAIALYKANLGRIGCAIVDLRMPGLDGKEVLRVLHEMTPDLPVILMSGFFREEAVERSSERPHVTFLHKPFDFRTLRERMDRLFPGSLLGGENIESPPTPVQHSALHASDVN